MQCIFCSILAGASPATFIHRDPVASVFCDIQPVNPGHVMVVPEVHAERLATLPPETGAHLFRTAQRVAQALLESSIRCDGVDLLLADGAVAGQEVPHVHLHVLPRFESDGFGFRFPERYFTLPDRAELDDVGTRLRAELERADDLDS